ncbi:MAG: hypothetical protein FD163_529 [Hyphomonadaceae bacterium]|nr:MAG: hypothetical protein FD163_529 [Hyphomonadaceae bacterium]
MNREDKQITLNSHHVPELHVPEFAIKWMEYLMNLEKRLAQFYAELLNEGGSIKTAHFERKSGKFSDSAAFVNYYVDILKKLTRTHRNARGCRLIILAMPMKFSAQPMQFNKNSIHEIYIEDEPPSFYICNPNDLCMYDSEEHIYYQSSGIDDLSVLFKSWRSFEGTKNNWEYSNVCFLWYHVKKIGDKKSGT